MVALVLSDSLGPDSLLFVALAKIIGGTRMLLIHLISVNHYQHTVEEHKAIRVAERLHSV